MTNLISPLLIPNLLTPGVVALTHTHTYTKNGRGVEGRMVG